MKHLQFFEEFINEGKSFEFTFNYNTDEDDVEYIQNILMNVGVDAIAEPGIDSEEMVVKAKNAVELRKAKKAIQADGFTIHESVVNENTNKKITVSLSSSVVKSFKKDLDGNKITYTLVRPTVFELEDTPKARMAIKDAKGRFGMQSVLVKESSIDEDTVNEAMSLKDYYRNSDKEVKEIAKQIDAIIDMAGLNINKKNDLLDLITDLTDAYLADMRNESVINEGNWSAMMNGVKSGGSGPWSIVAIEYNKVVGQAINIQIRDLIPASYESMKRKFPKAKLHIEDAGGQTVFTDK